MRGRACNCYGAWVIALNHLTAYEDMVDALTKYLGVVADHFKSGLGSALVDAYKLGSLAHGGFSEIYSDIDLGLLLDCVEAPAEMADWIAEAKSLNAEHGKK